VTGNPPVGPEGFGHRLVSAWLRSVPVPLGRGILCRLAHALFGKTLVRSEFGAVFRVDPRDTIQRSLYVHGNWEPHINAVFREVLRPGDAVVDVGSNIGWHALLASHLVGAGGTVLAFEPSAANRAALDDNLRRNGASTVRVLPVGLAAEEGERTLHHGPAWNLGGSALRPVERSSGSESIELARGDRVIDPETWDRVRLVKVDVEGAEEGVIEGLAGLLARRCPPYFVVEVTDGFLRELGGSEASLLARFRDLGYAMRRLSEPVPGGLNQYDALFSHSGTGPGVPGR